MHYQSLFYCVIPPTYCVIPVIFGVLKFHHTNYIGYVLWVFDCPSVVFRLLKYAWQLFIRECFSTISAVPWLSNKNRDRVRTREHKETMSTPKTSTSRFIILCMCEHSWYWNYDKVIAQTWVWLQNITQQNTCVTIHAKWWHMFSNLLTTVMYLGRHR